MNEFDKTVELKLTEAGLDTDGQSWEAQRLIHQIMDVCYIQPNSQQEIDDAIYRSKYYGKIKLGTALEIQRRVILRHIDQKS